jgi:hypothetical protein
VGNYIGFRASGSTCGNGKEGISLFGVERALISQTTISGFDNICILVQNGGYHNITTVRCGSGSSSTADGFVLRNSSNTTVADSLIGYVRVGIVLYNCSGAQICMHHYSPFH